MLTQVQRHQMVDSITKAGYLASWWENEEQPGIFYYYYYFFFLGGYYWIGMRLAN